MVSSYWYCWWVDRLGCLCVCDTQSICHPHCSWDALAVSDSSLIGSKFKPDLDDESGLANKLILQGCKVIGPFAALKNIILSMGLPKTHSTKVSFLSFTLIVFSWVQFLFCFCKQIMRCIMHKIVTGQGDQLSDLSTLANPEIVDVIKNKVVESAWVLASCWQSCYLDL